MKATLFDLSPAVGRNRYCGPGALAILLGIDTDNAAARLRAITGQRAIYGAHTVDMVQALRGAKEGVTVEGVAAAGLVIGSTRKPTLAQLAACLDPGVYLVNITGHFVVLRKTADGVDVADNHTVYPMPLAKFRRLRSRVKSAWKVVR